MPVEKQLRINIIGAGLSGGALANALLADPAKPFKVLLFERDDLAFSSERGGYQIRLGEDGIQGLKQCLSPGLYQEMREVWGNEVSRAPAIINPLDKTIVGCLGDLKVYPKSRAIPRSALKELLLRLPQKEGALMLGKKLTAIERSKNTYTGNTEVTCVFDDGSKSVCDILVAADGARSSVNRLMGINNAIAVDQYGVQGRGPISAQTTASLPKELTENGSLLMVGGEVEGFAAVYESSAASSGDSDKNDGSFLFWGVAMPEAAAKSIGQLETDEEKHRATMEWLKTVPAHPDLLPRIVASGVTNLKNVHLFTSKNPGDWRQGSAELGRIILIGDAIHSMTPGRGQGANQALRDAGALQALLKHDIGATAGTLDDAHMLDVATTYDAEMYKRAFAWVKSSQQASQLDVSKFSHRLFIRALFSVLHLVGIGMSILEALHLRRPAEVSF